MFVESTHTSVNHCNKRGVLQPERTGGELSRRGLLSEGEVFREKVSRGICLTPAWTAQCTQQTQSIQYI